MAFWSPASLGFACSRKRAAWSSGSFSSEKPLAISFGSTKRSKRSTIHWVLWVRGAGRRRCVCARRRVDAKLEAIDDSRVLVVAAGERRDLGREFRDEGGLRQ